VNLRVGFGATVWAKGVAHQALDGIGYYTQSLAQALAASHVDCHPVAFGQSDVGLQQNAVFQHLMHSGPRYPWSVLRSVLTGANFSVASSLRGRVDLFHATDHHIPKLKGIPVVATLMDAIPLSNPEWGNSQLRWLKNALWKKSVAWADQVITISEFSKAEIVQHFGIPADRIKVTYLGVDEKYSTPLPEPVKAATLQKFKLERPFFLCVGTLQPRKNIERLILAFDNLPDPVKSNFDLIIVGRHGWGVENLVTQLTQLSHNPRSHVKWLGGVSEADKLALLQSATSLVFPSLSEGFGLPLVEGFASGSPVIASNTTSLGEVAGSAAFGVDPLQTEALTQAMQTMADNSDLRSEFARKGRARAAEFTWAKCAAQTQLIYRSMV
jgi:alpha-1,3-rhamnosyl/mannosyltransferase